MTETAGLGLFGTGVMGAALALNIAEKGHGLALYNRSPDKLDALLGRAGPLAERLTPCAAIESFVEAIAPPRAIILMVAAGDAVEHAIEALLPRLAAGDVLIDAGNANFHDTRRRTAWLETAGRAYLGIGVSGGEAGARHGPAIMAGGSHEVWGRVQPVFDAIAAKHRGEPCCAWLGPDGAGHFVKMLHNGIEYADMQLIAEAYGLMRDGLGLAPAEMAEVFARWNAGPLRSYLIEIAAEVCATTDPETGRPLLEVIRDAAGQKGTGRWTVIEGQQLGVPVTIIEAAVAARNLSAQAPARAALQRLLGDQPGRLDGALGDREAALADLESALLAARIAAYDQGLAMIAAASQTWDWRIPLPRVLRVWRAGCIIRAALLDDMAGALESHDGSLLTTPHFAALVRERLDALRRVTVAALGHGLAAPALATALTTLDSLRARRGTADMIQGQRDFFGTHGFERLDREGTDFHGPWEK